MISWCPSYKNQLDYNLENVLEWDMFEGYLEKITEIYMKDDTVLNWHGDTENGKKMHRFVHTFESCFADEMHSLEMGSEKKEGGKDSEELRIFPWNMDGY